MNPIRRLLNLFKKPSQPRYGSGKVEVTYLPFEPLAVSVKPAVFDPNRVRSALEEGITKAVAGIKPPDEWMWDTWVKEMATLVQPGWAPCRFAHQTKDKAVFVFGVVRSPFGLWQRPFEVHVETQVENLFSEVDVRTENLTVITHLPTGYGLGLFEKRETAAQAAELAIRVVPNIASIEFSSKPGSPWHHAMQRMFAAWNQMGINQGRNCSAFTIPDSEGPYGIMGISTESANENRPEKLS